MRKVADCRLIPSEDNCTLAISGEEDEVVRAAAEHAVSAHGHTDVEEMMRRIGPELMDEGEGAGTALLKPRYEAFNRGDLDTVLEAFDPELVWNSPATLPFGGTYRGPEGALQFFGQLPQHFAELRVVPGQFLESGDTVVVNGQVQGRTTAGHDVDLRFAHTWTLREGRVREFTELIDTTALNAALGRGAPQATPASSEQEAHA